MGWPIQRINPVIVVFNSVIIDERVELITEERERHNNYRAISLIVTPKRAQSGFTICWKAFFTLNPFAHFLSPTKKGFDLRWS